MRKIEGGFGTISRNVMEDKKLTIEAKAIYCYLCVFAGNNDTCFPTVNTICNDLNISPKRFYKNINSLVESGIIKKNKDVKGAYGVIQSIQ
jgi:predicted transcriptional regulator